MASTICPEYIQFYNKQFCIWVKFFRTKYIRSYRRCSIKNVFLNISQNLQKSTCEFASTFIKKESPTQAFYCEFCKVFTNIFLMEHIRATDFLFAPVIRNNRERFKTPR